MAGSSAGASQLASIVPGAALSRVILPMSREPRGSGASSTAVAFLSGAAGRAPGAPGPSVTRTLTGCASVPPLPSDTVTLNVTVPGCLPSAGSHENAPLAGSIEAPRGAPSSPYVRALAGRALSASPERTTLRMRSSPGTGVPRPSRLLVSKYRYPSGPVCTSRSLPNSPWKSGSWETTIPFGRSRSTMCRWAPLRVATKYLPAHPGIMPPS